MSTRAGDVWVTVLPRLPLGRPQQVGRLDVAERAGARSAVGPPRPRELPGAALGNRIKEVSLLSPVSACNRMMLMRAASGSP